MPSSVGGPLGKDVRIVLGASVVVFVPDDTRKTGREEPLMLERVQGVPLLAWLVAALAQSGARRFFLVAQAGWMSRAPLARKMMAFMGYPIPWSCWPGRRP